MINHKRKILFIDICKTAGTSITKTLQKYYPEDKWEGKHHSVPNFTPKIASMVNDEILDEYSSFTVIRNPYDRMISLWVWGLGGDYHSLPFLKFVRNVRDCKYKEMKGHRYKTSLEWISDESGTIRVKNIIRYENLQEELNQYLNSQGMDSVQLIKENTKEQWHKEGHQFKLHEHYKEHYCEESQTIIRNLFKDEIEHFGFEF